MIYESSRDLEAALQSSIVNRKFSQSLVTSAAAKSRIIRFVPGFPLDVAADAGDLKFRGAFSREHGFECGAQIFSGHRNAIAGPAGVKLAAINQATGALERKNIRRGGGGIAIGDGLRFV